jgi:hypothetical protein
MAISWQLHFGRAWGHPCDPGALGGLFERLVAKNAMVK